MKVSVARQMLDEYYEISNPTEDDDFRYVEALEFLISSTKDPKYMCELAWFYCSKKRFDLESKYLEMAAEYGYAAAFEELGYMYYYGQHGVTDYEKAFKYFSMGAEKESAPDNLWCRYKLADMYHNGYYVEKDEAKYRELIEKAFSDAEPPLRLNIPFPEIAFRLAKIMAEDGEEDKAAMLLMRAKDFMAERLSIDPFWGYINVMGMIVRFMYEPVPFDEEFFDFYDIFYLIGKPGSCSFLYEDEKYSIEISEEDHAVGFDGKWYRNFEEFCQKAEINGEKFTTRYDELYNWKKVS